MFKFNKIKSFIGYNTIFKRKLMVGIIDYNMGNLASVYNACSKFTKDLKIVKMQMI